MTDIEEQGSKMFSFRVATYNIHKCQGLDRRVRPKRIADVLKEIDADVIALQEVVGMDEMARERNQVRAIAEELELDFRIGENRRHRGGAYGNAVLSRLPFVSDRNHDITWRGREPRGCLHVTVAVNDGPSAHHLNIYNVHLGTAFFERRSQAHRLLEVVNHYSEPDEHRIILGDFNEWTRGLATHLLSHHFIMAAPEYRVGRARTYPSVLPLMHLDHIYYGSQIELASVSVHRSRLALVASDHLPVVANFRLHP
jgi:endonuclease/exonuclease/phosphatase family metal-dependent hydrolase